VCNNAFADATVGVASRRRPTTFDGSMSISRRCIQEGYRDSRHRVSRGVRRARCLSTEDVEPFRARQNHGADTRGELAVRGESQTAP
jgi:hypothetical protein